MDLLVGARDNLPDRDRRRNRLSSVFCFRSSFSSVLLMASKEELEISRSSTFRSRLAFATSCGGLDDEVCEGSEKVSEVGELMVGSVLAPENALV